MMIAARIEKRLKALGLKRAAASRRAQLNETYVRDLIEGRVRTPRAEHLSRLAAVLHTTPEWLLEGRGPEQAGGDAASFQAAQTAWEKIPPRDRDQALKVLKSFVREDEPLPLEPEPPPPPKRRRRR
jgi:transcriptional regulator with XRE-family HTH domain